ncbi:MAG: hypothetical protein KUG54_00230 [Gammaproteobacteria bacterium]|nr:hypothetical protein [Gammaproteobacteria bacterium]
MATNSWVLWQTGHADQWQWCLPDSDGRFKYPVQKGSLATAANMIGSQPASLLLRSEQLLLTQATVQARQSRQVRAALPYLLEEQLAATPEQLHLAFKKSPQPNRYQVAVIEDNLLSGLINQLTAVGIRLEGAYPDCQGLNSADGGSLMIDDDRVLFKSTTHQFAAPLRLAGKLLHKTNFDSTKLTCFLTQNSQQNSPASNQATTLLEEINLTEQQCQPISEPLELLARGLDPSSATNLLQGSFKKAINRTQPGLPRLTRWLLLTLLGLPATGFLQQHLNNQQQLNRVTQQINTIHQQAFGSPAPTEDFRNNVSQQLARREQSQSGNQNNLPLTQLLSKFSTAKPGSITVVEITYQNSELNLIIQSPDLANADLLRSRLSGAQILGKLTITNRQSTNITIALTLTNPGLGQ